MKITLEPNSYITTLSSLKTSLKNHPKDAANFRTLSDLYFEIAKSRLKHYQSSAGSLSDLTKSQFYLDNALKIDPTNKEYLLYQFNFYIQYKNFRAAHATYKNLFSESTLTEVDLKMWAMGTAPLISALEIYRVIFAEVTMGNSLYVPKDIAQCEELARAGEAFYLAEEFATARCFFESYIAYAQSTPALANLAVILRFSMTENYFNDSSAISPLKDEFETPKNLFQVFDYLGDERDFEDMIEFLNEIVYPIQLIAIGQYFFNKHFIKEANAVNEMLEFYNIEDLSPAELRCYTKFKKSLSAQLIATTHAVQFFKQFDLSTQIDADACSALKPGAFR